MGFKVWEFQFCIIHYKMKDKRAVREWSHFPLHGGLKPKIWARYICHVSAHFCLFVTETFVFVHLCVHLRSIPNSQSFRSFLRNLRHGFGQLFPMVIRRRSFTSPVGGSECSQVGRAGCVSACVRACVRVRARVHVSAYRGACVFAQALVCLWRADAENSRSPPVTGQTRKWQTASAREHAHAHPPTPDPPPLHRNHAVARDWRHARTRVGWPRVTRGSHFWRRRSGSAGRRGGTWN